MVDREREMHGHLHVVDDRESPGCAVVDYGSLVVCALTGEIDLAVVGCLEEAVAGIDLDCVSTLEVDLTEVTFADSSALAWLLRLHERATADATALVVVVRDGPVRRLLDVTGTDQRLTIVLDGPARLTARRPGKVDEPPAAP
jgi:anti-anti-sigma factor